MELESNDFDTTLVQSMVERLRERQLKIVLAESCTAGLAAATMATIPGVSAWFCGSAVTYRESAKIDWLGLDADRLQQSTAVSAYASAAMATGVLARTPEADISAAITGHLGPNAPPQTDGVCFIALAARTASNAMSDVEVRDDFTIEIVDEQRIKLQSTSRNERQREAVHHLLTTANRWLLTQ